MNGYQPVRFFCSVPESGDMPVELDIYDFKGPGIALAMYNVDEVCLVNFGSQSAFKIAFSHLTILTQV